jgi:putative heme-binding domain-containing protein
VIVTVDGRVVTGVVAEQDANIVVARSSDGNEVSLARDQIDAIRPSPSLIMPEGLLSGLGDQQVRDLFAYLRSTQPLID